MGMHTLEITGDAQKHEAITPGDTATGITASLLKSADNRQARAAHITVEDNTIMYSLHGTAPTAKAGTNVGHAAAAGTIMLLKGVDEVRKFSCIDRVSGAAGIVKVTVFY